MKKNPRDYKVNGKMYAYILDSISSDDADVESMSDKERIEFALDAFYDEIYKNDRRRTSTLEKLTYWISGLCSTVNVAFTNYDIAKVGTEWGYCRTDARTSQFVRTWFERIANGILRLAKIYGVDMSRFRR
jgi:hypothetical protein|nr:MAG TPA: hypothetical protein [Caudoviricetes sp.]